jgi:hypothetical protein
MLRLYLLYLPSPLHSTIYCNQSSNATVLNDSESINPPQDGDTPTEPPRSDVEHLLERDIEFRGLMERPKCSRCGKIDMVREYGGDMALAGNVTGFHQ